MTETEKIAEQIKNIITPLLYYILNDDVMEDVKGIDDSARKVTEWIVEKVGEDDKTTYKCRDDMICRKGYNARKQEILKRLCGGTNEKT